MRQHRDTIVAFFPDLIQKWRARYCAYVVWFIATSIIYYRTLDMLAVAWILGLSIYGIPGLLMSWLADGAQKASKPIRWFVIAGAVLLVSVVVFCLLVVGLT